MALSPAEVNPVCEVHFEGFVSTTLQLARAGWQIAFEEGSDIYRDVVHLVIKHPPTGIVGWGEADFRGWRFSRMNHPPIFRIVHMTQKMIVTRMPRLDLNPDKLRLTSGLPDRMMIEEYDLARLPIFNEIDKPRGEELIVDPADVSELLTRIHQMQSSTQAEIRERVRRREVVPVSHATILTFPQAA